MLIDIRYTVEWVNPENEALQGGIPAGYLPHDFAEQEYFETEAAAKRRAREILPHDFNGAVRVLHEICEKIPGIEPFWSCPRAWLLDAVDGEFIESDKEKVDG